MHITEIGYFEAMKKASMASHAGFFDSYQRLFHKR